MLIFDFSKFCTGLNLNLIYPWGPTLLPHNLNFDLSIEQSKELSKEQSKALSKQLNCKKISALFDIHASSLVNQFDVQGNHNYWLFVRG